MSRDTYILIAFCVFMLLLGMRIRQRMTAKKGKDAVRINKNQRPKMAHADEPPEITARRVRREKRIRMYTIIQLFVLFGLMVFMVPALTKDIMMPSRIDPPNFFLRCLIFLLTIYVFILGYKKAFTKKDKEDQEDIEKG